MRVGIRQKRCAFVTAVVAAVVCWLSCASALAVTQFTPGDIFAINNDGDIWNVTGGGNFTNVSKFADIGSGNFTGHMAWSTDLSKMYVSNSVSGTVYAVTADGAVTPFATGLSGPTGLLHTQDGRLLVAEFVTGEITDITGGGDFSASTPWRSGLSYPTDMAVTAGGRIFAAERGVGAIEEITPSANVGWSLGLAGLTEIAVTSPGDELIANESLFHNLYRVGLTGEKTLFATGREIIGLARTSDGRLLGTSFNSNAVYDVTAGGDLIAAPLFATVSGATEVSVVPVAEPSVAILALPILILVAGHGRSARR